MRKILVIARREYLAAVKTRAFVIGLLIMPLMMSASAVLQVVLDKVRDTSEKRFGVVDRTGNPVVRQALEQAVALHNTHGLNDPQTGKQIRSPLALEWITPSNPDPQAIKQQRFDLSERVRHGSLFGFLDIGPDVLRTPHPAPGESPPESASLRYQSNRPTFLDFAQLAERTLTRTAQEQRAGTGENVAALRALLEPVPLLSKGLLTRNASTGEIEDATEQSRIAPVLVPGLLSLLMVMNVLMGATPLMQGVVEEKMQRIAEVLLGSVPPFGLMLGKLVGTVGVSLTMGGFYLAGFFWAAHRYGFGEYLSTPLILWFILFQALAALMYGALFIAVGAACTDMKETQSLMWPVMLLACLPLFVLGHVVQEPHGPVARTLSYFPFSTPMLLIARNAVPPGLPGWEMLLGMGLVLATTIACVWMAGRIFRVGILMQGQGARLSELVRWVVRG